MTVATYSQGTLLLGDTIADGNSRVLLVSRDLTIAPVGTSTGSAPGLRECVSEISPATAGSLGSCYCSLCFAVCLPLRLACLSGLAPGLRGYVLVSC